MKSGLAGKNISLYQSHHYSLCFFPLILLLLGYFPSSSSFSHGPLAKQGDVGKEPQFFNGVNF